MIRLSIYRPGGRVGAHQRAQRAERRMGRTDSRRPLMEQAGCTHVWSWTLRLYNKPSFVYVDVCMEVRTRGLDLVYWPRARGM